jgi:RNA polymerase sigma factor (sigma-70 family)
MRVFISWSGEPSCSIARSLYEWLPLVVQHVKPWMSDEAIESGTRWNDHVAAALNETDFGIVCVTGENQHKPWLMFEAGALAKRLNSAHVVPLCFGISPVEITGPLEAFQGRSFDEDGVKRLVREISAARNEPLGVDQVDTLFGALWPKLKSTIDDMESRPQPGHAVRRSTQDMLEELVERTRRIERTQSQRPSTIPWNLAANSWDSGLREHVELVALLNNLTPRQREVLLLRIADGLTAEEAAQQLGSTPGAVRVTQHRALNKLRQILSDEHDTDTDGEGDGDEVKEA